METNLKPSQHIDSLNVLLIGNNPIEMGNILDNLNRIRSRKVIAEIAFDLKSIFERLSHFRPQYILIDDNIGKTELRETVDTLTHYRKTKNIPITVLKNSNYEESGNADVLDYILKKGLSGEALINGLKNSFKFKRTQLYLQKTYKKRKRELLRLVGR
ncbi:MAG TPA: hypothetical protein VL443_22545 [Cyclobacteriaceae bacterium]|nr:hypothetical protein [Cyclobacteriaceae bacterium]